jgi:hypothetical protein
MRSTCPSCGAATSTNNEVARRVRCKTCGTVRTVGAANGSARKSRADVIMSVSSISSGGTRTVVLLADGTTELREGGIDGQPTVVGSTPRAVVRTWSSMRTPKHFELRDGAWNAKTTERVIGMVHGVWGTVAPSPL